MNKITVQKLIVIICLLATAACNKHIAESEQQQTFTNPLLTSGEDPWNIYKDGFYYYTQTMGDSIVIWKTENLSALKTAIKKTVWIPPKGTDHSKDLWAPEIHFVEGKWYIYYAADNGRNINHRLYVIENPANDPLTGEWTFKGKIADSTDKWAIDGSVFKRDQQLYIIWSGWEGNENGAQNIYIAKMKNPWTIDGKRVCISRSTYEWEKHGDLIANEENPSHVDVNEGPQILQHENNMFLVYSASGCWTDYYSLGMLTFTGKDNLLDSASWKKSTEPVFKQSALKEVYAPGHNSFFKSPDGKEDWILYHANPAPELGCRNTRSPRAQKFSWNTDGTPYFDEPVKTGYPLAVPSH